MMLEFIWKIIGKQESGNTEQKSDSGPYSYQSEHIEIPTDNRFPGAYKKHPTGIKNYRE